MPRSLFILAVVESVGSAGVPRRGHASVGCGYVSLVSDKIPCFYRVFSRFLRGNPAPNFFVRAAVRATEVREVAAS